MKAIILITMCLYPVMGFAQCDIETNMKNIGKLLNQTQETFVKDFPVEMTGEKDTVKYSMILKDSTSYRFYFIEPKAFKGQGKIELYKAGKSNSTLSDFGELIGTCTNKHTDEIGFIDFNCYKTEMYQVLIINTKKDSLCGSALLVLKEFLDNKKGWRKVID